MIPVGIEPNGKIWYPKGLQAALCIACAVCVPAVPIFVLFLFTVPF
jgi:hypothetical protein